MSHTVNGWRGEYHDGGQRLVFICQGSPEGHSSRGDSVPDNRPSHEGLDLDIVVLAAVPIGMLSGFLVFGQVDRLTSAQDWTYDNHRQEQVIVVVNEIGATIGPQERKKAGYRTGEEKRVRLSLVSGEVLFERVIAASDLRYGRPHFLIDEHGVTLTWDKSGWL